MMPTRRVFTLLLAAAAFVAALPASAREIVSSRGYAAGTVVIVTHTCELFYMIGHGQAIRYPVGVGRVGMAWHGRA